MQRDSEEFVSLITQAQSSLYGFIRTLVPNATGAQDVLQNANLTIWKKADEFVEGSSFMSWACRIAYLHSLEYRRKNRREVQIFDQETMQSILERQTIDAAEELMREAALEQCMEALTPQHRDLLKRRYGPQGSVMQAAKDLGKSVGAVSQSLFRIRELLAECIERRIRTEAHP